VKPSVYIETSVISYLVGWLNRNDLQVAAHQELTRRWWTSRVRDFDLFVSAAVLDEAREGNTFLAAERLRFLKGMPLLRITDEAHDLKAELLRRSRLPAKAGTDALHIAVATVHGMGYLATWNCKHIANAVTLPFIYDTCRDFGYEPPLICTPYELLGETYG
jgi:predicted nucleic acid-binding protein